MKYLLLICLGSLLACQPSPKNDFQEWYANRSKSKKKTVNGNAPVHRASFYSAPLHIDTIYRSMQGPYEIKNVNLEADDELIWIVGYESKVERIDTSGTKLPDKFMCHNNLNYANEEHIPWKIKTTGANSRIFTLSEGQTSLTFPEGFGIPVPADQAFEMVSQVLNHEERSIDISTRHHVTFSYLKDSEISRPLTPLYQQSVFVTKQISGPAGSYGLPHLCVEHHLDSNNIKGKKPKHDCSVDFSGEDYNPYQDQHGRKYTGHWKIPYGKEVLSTDVTQMLDLEENSSIHMIGVHLHPFAKKLELWDKTIDSLLYTAKIRPKPKGLGFEKIEYYQNPNGIAVYKDHRYELKSTYHCTDSSEQHTAMAVMYLYLTDR